MNEKPPMNHRQLGRFFIDGLSMAQALDDVAIVMTGLVIKSVQPCFSKDAVEYLAIGADFDEVERGCEIPEYWSQITKDEDGKITSVEWVRVSKG